MMQTYWIFTAVGSLIAFAVFALRLKGRGLPPALAGLSLPLAALCGFVCAKAGFVLLKADAMLSAHGLAAFLRMRSDEFSFVLGAVGVCLGVALAAKMMRKPAARALDAFAPCGALLVAVWRWAEKWLGTLGAGDYVEDGTFFARLPFGIQNEYGEWFPAIFLLEALLALLAAAVFFIRRDEDIPGLSFEEAAFMLALCQVVCESLRARSITWGFVRVEQVLCGVILLGLTVRSCRKAGGPGGFFRKYGEAVGVVGCMLPIIGAEFALGKNLLPIDDPALYYAVCYGAMLLSLAGMALLERRAIRRRKAAEGGASA